MERIAVLLPVYNEEGALGSILEEFKELGQYDVIVIDDASTDNSLAIAHSYPDVAVLPLAVNLGAWGALQTGIRYALKKNYKLLITMDADGQHHVNQLTKILSVINKLREVDVVIGACPTRGSRLRHWAWSYFRRLTGVGIEDITSGFRAYKSSALKVLSRRSSTLIDYQDVGVLLQLQEAGLSVVEVQVKMSERVLGKSHVYYSWFAVAYYMLSTTILSIAKRKPFTIKRVSR